jgi:alpha-1,2-mannosyltransferase
MWQMTITKPINVRIAWLLWLALFLIAALPTLTGRVHDVTHHYHTAAIHWFHGEPMYDESGHGFLYFPQSAILYSPFAYLPGSSGEIVWRAVILAVFAAGVCRLARLAGRISGLDFFPITTMFCLPLAFSSERNGQATLIMAGLMMLAAVDLVDRRWWRASIYLALGVAFKPLCLVMLLLAAVLYPATAWRLAVCIGLLVAMPFLTASPDYVFSQYADCGKMLHAASDRGLETNWAQLFGLLDIAGLEVPQRMQFALRLFAAAATLGFLVFAKRRLPQEWVGTYCYVLAICYLMLFNPRTENNSYSALAPAIGIFFCHDVLVRRRYPLGIAYVLLSIGILCTYYVCRLVTGPDLTTWLSPLMGALFTAIVVVQVFRWHDPPAAARPRSLIGRRAA